jgi:hypothetical protein
MAHPREKPYDATAPLCAVWSCRADRLIRHGRGRSLAQARRGVQAEARPVRRQRARCQDPANAALRRYDGKGISTAHTRACVARVLSKRRSGYGYRYSVTQSCIDAGSGPGKRFTERQTIDVPDALTFSMPAKGGTTYRYCPLDQLPPELRSAAPASHP